MPSLNYDLRARALVFLLVIFLLLLLLLLFALRLLLPHLCPEGIAVLNLVSRFTSYISLSSRETSKSRLFLQRDCVNDILDMCTFYTNFRSLIDIIYFKYIV